MSWTQTARVQDIPPEDIPEVLDLLLEKLGLHLERTRIPDYTLYELVAEPNTILHTHTPERKAP